MNVEQQPASPPLAYSVKELARVTHLSEQTIRREIEEGRLRAKRVRNRIVIPRTAAEEWLNQSLIGEVQ